MFERHLGVSCAWRRQSGLRNGASALEDHYVLAGRVTELIPAPRAGRLSVRITAFQLSPSRCCYLKQNAHSTLAVELECENTGRRKSSWRVVRRVAVRNRRPIQLLAGEPVSGLEILTVSHLANLSRQVTNS